MKFLYSKFTKAFSEVLLIVFLVILLIGGIAMSEMYTNDILDGGFEFRKTGVANNLAYSYSSGLMSDVYMYAEDFSKKEDGDLNTENETGIYTSYYAEYAISIDIEKVLKNSEEVRNKVLAKEKKENINYHFVIKNEEEVLLTDIEDMSLVTLVNEVSHRLVNSNDDGSEQFLYVESYINKELVKGDNFYKYNYFYDVFVKNFWKIVVCMVISAAMVIILGIYIVVTAGYKDDGTLGLSWIDNIPIELFFLLFVFWVLLTYDYTTYNRYANYVLGIIVICIWAFMIITLGKTVLARLKNRVFFKKSIIGMVILTGIKYLKEVFININTKLKAAFCIGVVMFCEVFSLLIFSNGYFFNGLWFLVKAAQFILLMYIYSMALRLRDGARAMHEGETEVKIDTNGMNGIIRESAEYMNDIFAGMDKAVAEKLKSEQLKTELITNVSHDIKTPLTSIINYIDLMKKEEIDNQKVREYLEIADKQSLRLKKLTEDIIEASKAATRNIKAELTGINVSEMISQALGEYENKFNDINLNIVYENGEVPHYALADGRLLWRVIDNLFSNVCKYTLEGTRLYIHIGEKEEYVHVTIKNISKYQLNISSEELMQRFVRGDASRSTSGNGLGLSIAESLTKLQEGMLNIDINGDLFIVCVLLKKIEKEEERKEEND